MDSTFRELLFVLCKEIVSDKIKAIQESLQQAQDSLIGETKSSAGDKYETSREMIQQDLNRLQRQLVEADKDRIVLENMENIFSGKNQVTQGSLVETDHALYYIAVSIGRVVCENKEVYVISSLSPIGKLLLGQSVGSQFVFNNKTQKILAVE